MKKEVKATVAKDATLEEISTPTEPVTPSVPTPETPVETPAATSPREPQPRVFALFNPSSDEDTYNLDNDLIVAGADISAELRNEVNIDGRMYGIKRGETKRFPPEVTASLVGGKVGTKKFQGTHLFLRKVEVDNDFPIDNGRLATDTDYAENLSPSWRAPEVDSVDDLNVITGTPSQIKF